MKRIILPSRPELALEFEPDNQADFGPCPDCGQNTKRVWGHIYRKEAATAAYFVEWTPTHAQKDAAFDLILGKWGEAAGSGEPFQLPSEFSIRGLRSWCKMLPFAAWRRVPWYPAHWTGMMLSESPSHRLFLRFAI